MSRLARGFGVVIAPAVALIVLAGCGGGHKHSSPPTTIGTSVSTIATSTTTEPVPASPSTSSPTAPSTTTSTTPASVTTTAGGPQITEFTVTPATPVCNAPTMIQLQWTATAATSVDLAIDGQPFASYGGGTQSHLEYFACDRKPHTYTLTAHRGSSSTTASKVVTGTTNAA